MGVTHARLVVGSSSTSVPFSRCMMKAPAFFPSFETAMKSSMLLGPLQAGFVSGFLFWLDSMTEDITLRRPGQRKRG